jgi:hypothetical protein
MTDNVLYHSAANVFCYDFLATKKIQEEEFYITSHIILLECLSEHNRIDNDEGFVADLFVFLLKSLQTYLLIQSIRLQNSVGEEALSDAVAFYENPIPFLFL